jgi:hypothetical protein
LSRSGILVPRRVLKSPQMKAVSWGWRVSRSSSSWLVASVSSMCRLVSEVLGGIYVFTILIRRLFGNIIFVCKPYSLPYLDSICSGFRMNVARPPRVLFGRRCSTTVKPSNIGAAAPSAIQVSYRHRMSTCSYSSRRSSLRYVNPYIFRLPILIPYEHQRVIGFVFVWFFLLEPFVRAYLYCI